MVQSWYNSGVKVLTSPLAGPTFNRACLNQGGHLQGRARINSTLAACAPVPLPLLSPCPLFLSPHLVQVLPQCSLPQQHAHNVRPLALVRRDDTDLGGGHAALQEARDKLLHVGGFSAVEEGCGCRGEGGGGHAHAGKKS